MERRNKTYDTAILLVLLLAFSLVFRLATLEMIETGGDALRKWRQVKSLYLGFGSNDWSWDHHTARFGINIPTYFSLLIFGRSPWVYYVPTLSFFLLLVTFVFQIGKKIGSPSLGVIAGLALVIHPSMVRAGSQLLPSLYSATYITGAFWLLLESASSVDRTRWLRLCAAAFLAFLGYLSKVQTVFFVPGLAISVLLLFPDEKRKALLIFVSALGGLYVCETIAYAMWTDFPLGRIQIIRGSYGHSGRLEEMRMDSLMELFGRFSSLSSNYRWFFYIYGIIAAAALIVYRRIPKAILALLATSLSFLVFMTFALKSFNPIVPLTLFHKRYLTEVYPLMILVTAFLVSFVVKYALTRWLNESRKRQAAKYSVSFALVLLITGFRGEIDVKHPRSHPFSLLHRYDTLSLKAYNEDIPVLAHGPKADHAYRSVFIDAEMTMAAERTPLFKKCLTIPQPCRYFVRNSKGLGERADDEIVILIDRHPMSLRPVQIRDLHK